jgi:hypothetical protein
MKATVCLAAFMALAILLQMAPLPTLRAQAAASGDLEIYESVIRYQIKSWELHSHTYCIRVLGKDAEQGLLERLNPLPIKVASACREQHVYIQGKDSGLGHVVDKATKQNSVIFDVGGIRRLSESELEVEGGYDCGSHCMASGVYRLTKLETGWRVTDFEWHVIS